MWKVVDRRGSNPQPFATKALQKPLEHMAPQMHSTFFAQHSLPRRWSNNLHKKTDTLFHSGTLCIQRKVKKFPCFWCLVFGAQFQHFLSAFWRSFFCYAVSSCVYDHDHPHLVSERIFLAENKAFPYLRRALAHPRRALAILWDAAATWPVVMFVVVAAKQRSPKISVACCVRVPVDRLPYRSLLVTLNGHCGVIFQSIFKPNVSLERSCPDLNEHVLFFWIGRETAERRPFEVCRRIAFAFDRRQGPLYNSLPGYPKYETNALLWRH